MNLNGLWNYAVLPKGANMPSKYQGEILVPYSIESSLSGVGKSLLPSEELWYQRKLYIPEAWQKKDIILHFGSVDYEAFVYVNGKLVGKHVGSSDPFSFNITPHLKVGEQEIIVRVWDPTDSEIQPRGKQTLNPKGFWYTAVSGIWQTVWIEPVERTRVRYMNPVPDIDNSTIELVTDLENAQGDEILSVKVLYKGEIVQEKDLSMQGRLSISISNPQLWTPDSPHVYDLEIELKRKGSVIDKFSSYFAMRKISLGKDEKGIERLLLNNQPLFQWGVLDQGWWPESLLTPPSDEALKYDMIVLKKLGFNMIRKHLKVEPARFYFHADTMGLLVWQDMPSGFLEIHHPEQHLKFDAKEDWARPHESAKDFESEWKSIIDNLRFFPSIVMWVPFNEGWGQYDTKRISKWTEDYDPSRLVNATSGWTDRNVGHVFDSHQYPGPSMEPPVQNSGRAIVLGEFGGLGWPIEGHLWNEQKRNWGYRTYQDEVQYLKEYATVIQNVYPLISRGLSAAIYTQTSDVEGEVNGLMTYDRKVLKLPEAETKLLHDRLYLSYATPQILLQDSEIEPSNLYLSTKNPGKNWTALSPTSAKFKETKGPFDVTKGMDVWSVNSFEISDLDKTLAMKLYGRGDLKIYLNGHLVYDKKISTKRHYDEYNLTESAQFVNKGKNIIALELRNASEDSIFDYGLYHFK